MLESSMCTDKMFERVQHQLRKEYIHRRMCPQEILQPNEEVEVEDEEEADFGIPAPKEGAPKTATTD